MSSLIKPDKVNILESEKRQLIAYIKELIDYSMCMRAATGYRKDCKTKILNICREVNEMERR